MVKNKYVLKTVLLLLIAVLFLFVIAQNIDSALQVCSGTDTSCGNNELDCQDCTSLSGCSSGYQITYECFVDFDDQNCGILGDSCTSSCCGAIGGSCIGGVCEIDAGTCSGSVSCFDGYSTGCCQGAVRRQSKLD